MTQQWAVTQVTHVVLPQRMVWHLRCIEPVHAPQRLAVVV
jgi:hypothetical protein